MKEKNLFKNKEFSLLANNVGLFIEYWGFKNIQGQIWLLLFVSNIEFSTKELKDIFGVSKAMMSLVLNELLEYEVIISHGTGKHGVELYKANRNILSAIFHVLKKREMYILEKCLKSLNDLIKLYPIMRDDFIIDEARLSNLEKLVSYANIALSRFFKLDVSSWKKWKVFKSN